MTRWPVRISTDAEAQLLAVRSWWVANRPLAPDLFDRELDAAVFAIGDFPTAFPLYRRENEVDVRRALLPKARHSLYFSIMPDHVLIVAIWHSARGSGPALP